MIPNAKPQTKRIEPMTPEEAAQWEQRKTEQWTYLSANDPVPGVTLSLVQTRHTFTIHAHADDGFSDELVFGDPAKTVPRDDRLFNLRAIDLSDEQIKAAFAEWRLRRRLPPPPSRVI